MAQLRHDQYQFISKKTEIIIIGPENASAFTKYWQENHLSFIGLPDPTHSVLKLYGQEVNLFKLGRMPAQMVVDKQGTLRFIHYGHSMSDIPQNAELLALLEKINSETE
ncbi:MAG: redoxin domain-containing protein [Anaerolineaceae bacterium]|nr:redoxin domain-containing protein [Anaerolineaceae bacterium]